MDSCLTCPVQSCCDPMVSKMSMERKEAMALQMILLCAFPNDNRADPRAFVKCYHAMSGARSDGSRYSVQILRHNVT